MPFLGYSNEQKDTFLLPRSFQSSGVLFVFLYCLLGLQRKITYSSHLQAAPQNMATLKYLGLREMKCFVQSNCSINISHCYKISTINNVINVFCCIPLVSYWLSLMGKSVTVSDHSLPLCNFYPLGPSVSFGL